MTFYVHIADSCQVSAHEHGLESKIEDLKNQIESTQKLVGFTKFRPTHLMKRHIGRGFRLLTFDQRYGENRLIIFLQVFPRSDSTYEWIVNNHENFPEEAEDKVVLLNKTEMDEIYNHLSSDPEVSAQVFNAPSDDERSWLYEIFTNQGVNNKDLLVLESKEWVAQMNSEKMRDFLAFYQSFLDNIDLDEIEQSDSLQDIKHLYSDTGKLGILYSYLKGKNKLFLIYPLRNIRQNEIDEYKNRFFQIYSQKGEIRDSQDSILRFSKKAYPFFMTLDCDFWLDIQKEKEANLALSPEEGNLLDGIRSADMNSAKYPLFINGRAGSGKSTILQYLMADFSEFALKNETSLYPLYITYSYDLLKAAKDTVKRLLTTHSTRLLEGTFSDQEIDKVLEKSFVVFHDFLLNLLPNNSKKFFAGGKFISYSEFQRLWNIPGKGFGSRADARHLDVGIAWHIIRSYIKGIKSSNDYFNDADFRALPKKRRSVTEETFNFVYDKVWEKWYQPLSQSEGYWDDQDLVSEILDADIVNDLNYASILCDESQDFTSIELEFILQLSVFSKRRLAPQELVRVPFIFAGDPLQTLNPTGFRWENIQADFYDKFVAVLDPDERSKVEINYEELQFNYRSNSGIVKFCNLLQLLRLCLVGGQNISAQTSWWLEDPVQVIWFDVNDLKTQQEIKQNPEIVKIINCDLGDETYYVQQDSVLRNMESYEENIYQNILSPTRSKGLEFPRVILYCFGDTAPTGFEKLVDNSHQVMYTHEQLLKYEYFLNRLYVAASRAKRQLIIIDSREAIEKFWKFATDPKIIEVLAKNNNDFADWQEKIDYIVRGSQEAWTGESIDITAQAYEYKNQGYSARDPYLLRQAALSFRSIVNRIESVKCFALAFELEERFDEAGNTYLEAGLYEEAFNTYWKGQEFSQIQKLIQEYSSLARHIRSRISNFMADSTIGVSEALITELREMLSNTASQSEFLDNAMTWHSVFREILQRLVQTNTFPWGTAYSMLKLYLALNPDLDQESLGRIAYRAGFHKDAIQYFEAAHNTELREYFDSQAKENQFPNNLIWLYKLNKPEEIIQNWEENSQALDNLEHINNEIQELVFNTAFSHRSYDLAYQIWLANPDKIKSKKLYEYFIKSKQYDRAWSILEKFRDNDCVTDLLTRSLKDRQTEIALNTALLRIELWMKQGEWKQAIDFVDKKFLEDVGQTLILQFCGKPNVFHALRHKLVYEIAKSNDWKENPSDPRNIAAAEFLFKNFIAPGPFQSIKEAGLSIELVGSAIEKAGKYNNLVRFYDSLETYRDLPQDKRKYVGERLIVSLERRVKFLRDKKQFNQADDDELWCQALRNKFKIPLDQKLSPYPNLAEEQLSSLDTYKIQKNQSETIDNDLPPIQLKVITDKDDQLREWKVGHLTCKCSSNRKIWRIENEDSLEALKFSTDDFVMSGDVKCDPFDLREPEGKAGWVIPSWDSSVLIYERSDYREIIIACGYLESLSIKVSL